jgi:hypothetical protein
VDEQSMMCYISQFRDSYTPRTLFLTPSSLSLTSHLFHVSFVIATNRGNTRFPTSIIFFVSAIFAAKAMAWGPGLVSTVRFRSSPFEIRLPEDFDGSLTVYTSLHCKKIKQYKQQ